MGRCEGLDCGLISLKTRHVVVSLLRSAWEITTNRRGHIILYNIIWIRSLWSFFLKIGSISISSIVYYWSLIPVLAFPRRTRAILDVASIIYIACSSGFSSTFTSWIVLSSYHEGRRQSWSGVGEHDVCRVLDRHRFRSQIVEPKRDPPSTQYLGGRYPKHPSRLSSRPHQLPSTV